MQTPDAIPIVTPSLRPPCPRSIGAMTLDIVRGTHISLPTRGLPLGAIEGRLRRIGDLARRAGLHHVVAAALSDHDAIVADIRMRLSHSPEEPV